MSLLFFNILFIFYYYFKIVNFLYIDFMSGNVLLNIMLTNLIILVFDVVYIYLYKFLNMYKLSYFYILLIGVFLGLIVSLVVL